MAAEAFKKKQMMLDILIEEAVAADALVTQTEETDYAVRMLNSCRWIVHMYKCSVNSDCTKCPKLRWFMQHYNRFVCRRDGASRKDCSICSLLNEVYIFHARNCRHSIKCPHGGALHCPEFKLLLVRSELQIR